jgi:hypothetical protein
MSQCPRAIVSNRLVEASSGPRLVMAQTVCLFGPLAPDSPHTLQQADLLGPGPVQIPCQPGRCPNPSDLNPTMPLASVFGLVVFGGSSPLLPKRKKPGFKPGALPQIGRGNSSPRGFAR